MLISSLAFREGVYELVMTESTKGQIFRVRERYSDIRSILHKWWDESYYITSLVYSDDLGWMLVMTEDEEGAEEVVHVRAYFPEELIEFYAGSGFRVAHIAYDGQDWVLVMTTRRLRL